MKHGWRVMLVVGILSLGTLVVPGTTTAACYMCDPVTGCQEACATTNGKKVCTQTEVWGQNGPTVTSCSITGSICSGTRECSACSPALEECGIENSGASLIVPHGQLPPGGSWLEKKDRELRLCRATVGSPSGPRAMAVGPVLPGRS